MDWIGEWVRNISVVLTVLTLIMLLLPECGAKRIAGMVGTAALAMVVLSPLKSCGGGGVEANIERYQKQLEERAGELEKSNEALRREVVKSGYEELIESYAQSKSLKCAATVTLALDENENLYPYKVKVAYKTRPKEEERMMIVTYIAEQLGVPSERQSHIY